jgi:hypothetical protein
MNATATRSTTLFSSAPAEVFAAAVEAARAALGALGGNLADYTVGDFERMQTSLSEDGMSGFAIKGGGELVNVFSRVKGRGDAIVEAAVEAGAARLDCYDGYLAALYGRHGFLVVERSAWCEEYAPEGWDFDRHGRPDFLVMARI